MKLLVRVHLQQIVILENEDKMLRNVEFSTD